METLLENNAWSHRKEPSHGTITWNHRMDSSLALQAKTRGAAGRKALKTHAIGVLRAAKQIIHSYLWHGRVPVNMYD